MWIKTDYGRIYGEKIFLQNTPSTLKSLTLEMAMYSVDSENHTLVVFDTHLSSSDPYSIRGDRWLYPLLGAQFKQCFNSWTFPNGSTIRFTSISAKYDICKWLGCRFSKVYVVGDYG